MCVNPALPATGDRPPHLGILDSFCQRLPTLVAFRLDPRIAGRIPASEIAEEISNSLRDRAASHRCPSERSLFLCLRSATMGLLERIHHEYLGHEYRGHGCATIRLRGLPEANVRELATALLGLCSPRVSQSPVPVRQLALQQAFNRLDCSQRELLAMRHFERLTREEIAAVSSIPKKDVGLLYMRALARLKDELSQSRIEPSPLLWEDYAYAC